MSQSNHNHEQMSNNESLVQIQNPNMYLNPAAQQAVHTQPSLISRAYATLITTNPTSILKFILLVLILCLTLYLTITYLHTSLSSKSPPISFTSSLKLSPSIYQIGAPQQTAYISFHYFEKMIQIAKENVRKGNKWDGTEQQMKEFQQVDFWQLYGVFKVLKAVQLANNYEQVDQQSPEQQANPADNPYQTWKNLSTPINLTKYFNRAADQSQCASCYSFPITATIQYQIMKRQGKLVKLSEQELIECSGAPDIEEKDQEDEDQKYNGCNDGNVTKGFQYARDVGLVEQLVYPYRSQMGRSYQCKKDLLNANSTQKYKIKGFRTLATGDCRAIQYQLTHGNAVATMINVGRMSNIKNFTQPFRDCIRTGLNHAVTIVGQTENQDWIVRNSWGENWGNNGYFVIKKGNTCGVCTHAMVPFFDGDQLEEIKKSDN